MNDASNDLGVWSLASGAALLLFLYLFLDEWAAVRRGGATTVQRLRALRGEAISIYVERINRGLDWFARFIGDHHLDGRPNFFSAQSFLVCLGVAVLYPLWFMLLVWAMAGGPAMIGELAAVSDGLVSSSRFLLILALLAPLIVAAIVRSSKTHSSERFWLRLTSIAAIAVAGTIAGEAAGLFALILAGGSAGALAFNRAFAGTFAFALAIAVTLLSAGTVYGYVAILFGAVFAFLANQADYFRRMRRWLVLLLCIVTLSPAYFFAAFDPGSEAIDLARDTNTPFSLLFFVVLLPAINAPFDWLSLAISRHLIRYTANVSAGMLGTLSNEIVRFMVMLFDAAIALGLSVLIVAVTTFAVAALNWVSIYAGGEGMGFAVSDWLAGLRADPAATEFWWVYAMVFSTLIPTTVHVFAVGGAWGSAVLGRLTPFLSWLADWVEDSRGRAFASIGPALVLAFIRVALGVLAPVLLFRLLLGALTFIGAFHLLGVTIEIPNLAVAFGELLLRISEIIARSIER